MSGFITPYLPVWGCWCPLNMKYDLVKILSITYDLAKKLYLLIWKTSGWRQRLFCYLSDTSKVSGGECKSDASLSCLGFAVASKPPAEPGVNTLHGKRVHLWIYFGLDFYLPRQVFLTCPVVSSFFVFWRFGLRAQHRVFKPAKCGQFIQCFPYGISQS